MRNLIAVALGGSIGALARYGVNVAVARWWRVPFPVATLLINAGGCLLLGWFLARAGRGSPADPALRLFVATGICGAFTTFSTFAHETRDLAVGGSVGAAVANVALSLAAGLVAVALGARLGA